MRSRNLLARHSDFRQALDPILLRAYADAVRVALTQPLPRLRESAGIGGQHAPHPRRGRCHFHRQPVIIQLPQLQYFVPVLFLAIGVMPDLSCALRGASQLQRVAVADSAGVGDLLQSFVSHVDISIKTSMLPVQPRSKPKQLEILNPFPGLWCLAVDDGVHAIVATMAELYKRAGERAPLWPNLHNVLLAEYKRPVIFGKCLQDFVRHSAKIKLLIHLLNLQPVLAAPLEPTALRWL